MANFDKVVKMNLTLVKGDFLTFALLTVILGIVSQFGLFFFFAPIIFFIVIIYYTYKGYNAIVYKPTYGEDAIFYSQLPVSLTESIWAKIISLAFFQLGIEVVSLLVIGLSLSGHLASSLTNDLMYGLELYVNNLNMGGIILFSLSIWVFSFMQILLIFYFILRFGKPKKEAKFDPSLFALAVFYLVINQLPSGISYIADQVNSFVLFGGIILIEVIVSVVLYKLIFKFYESEAALS